MARVYLKGQHKRPSPRRFALAPPVINGVTTKKGERAGRQRHCYPQRHPRPFRPYQPPDLPLVLPITTQRLRQILNQIIRVFQPH